MIAFDVPSTAGADEVPLQCEEHHQRDERLHEGSCGQQVLVAAEVSGECGDEDRRRPGIGIGAGHRVGDQEVVPRPQELEDAERGEHRHRQRQHESPEDREVISAVDPCRLEHVTGQRRDVVVQQEDRERQRETGVGQPHRRRRVHEVEVRHDRDRLVTFSQS